MGDKRGDAVERLASLGAEIRSGFVSNRRVISYAEYLDLVAKEPTLQLRSAPQFMKACFEHFGTEQAEYPWGNIRRFKLFDCEWADGRERLVGQERVQNRVYRSLCNFVNEGMSNKLVLLHGPNGSAKSTFVRCIGRAMQEYSALPQGALYRINWVFPKEKVSKGGIGFSHEEDAGGGSSGGSYARLPDELVDARLSDELRDHPILLIPPEQRGALIDDYLGACPDAPDLAKNFVLSDYIRHGRLNHKNRAIYEALLASYHGDFAKVLRHVQIERFFICHRYREGYATVEPRMSVDASERQVTADRSISALPPALQSVSLFEYGGELVAANRGMVEYSDLLKRPLEAYKYLITTVERAQIGLANANLYLDLVMLGTTNEIHLSAFKEVAEFQSFRGRIELVRVPYLLDVEHEEALYQAKLTEAAPGKHVAPNSAHVAALWAILTRLRKPVTEQYEDDVSRLLDDLTPLEKADLYARGKPPERLSATDAKVLRAAIPALYRESEAYPNYEGRTGASPREMQSVLFNAANSPRFSYVSPLAVLEEIKELTTQTTVFGFLRQDSLPGGYHDHRRFVDEVRERLIERTDEAVRTSLGLVDELQYEQLFDLYIIHVMNWTKKEKIRNPQTGVFEAPDERMMKDIEERLSVVEDAREGFRHDLIARIGGWSLDHRNERPIYHEIFEEFFRRLRDAYYQERSISVRGSIHELEEYLKEFDATATEANKKPAGRALATLCERFGYTPESARDAVFLLVRERYA